MLKFHLSTADFAGPWAFEEGAWRSGGSVIVPFGHRFIETMAVTAAGRTCIVIRENPHRSPDHGTCRDGVPVSFGRASDWPLNCVTILLDASAPAATFEASAHSTAPLFIAQSSDALIGDWDVANLYGRLPLAIDEARTAFSLCHLGLPYSRRTMFRDIWQLTERSSARWQPAKRAFTVDYPSPLLRMMPRTVEKDADIETAFENLFGAVLSRAAGSGPVACEISGGLDSGVAALVAARTFGPDRVHAFGLLLPGGQKHWQAQRRDELVRSIGVPDLAIDADGRGPFSAGDLADVDPATPWGEYYREAFLPLSEAVAAAGLDVVIRGIGGDEISELLPTEAHLHASTGEFVPMHLPSYITKAAAAAYSSLDDLDEAPAAAAPSSFYQAAAASAPVYMRRGIWPIYPYGTPEIVDFCRSLPTRWRADRRLQRSLLRSAGLSAQVVRPSVPETFLPLRDLMFSGAASRHVAQLFQEPILAELGLVDEAALADAFASAAANQEHHERTRLLEAATIETVLRTWRGAAPALGP